MRSIAHLVMTLAGLLALAHVGPAPGQGSTQEELKKLVLRAQELAKKGQYDEAVDVMKKALPLAPKNDLAYCLALTSDMEREAGRFADAVKHALEAIKLNDKVGPYYILVAAAALANQDLDLAREYVKKVIDKGEQAIGAVTMYDARQLEDAVFPRTYTIHWDLDPKKGYINPTTGETPLALPRGDLPNQSVTYTVKGARKYRLVKGEANQVLYVMPLGVKPFRVTTKITLEPYSYKKELAKATKGPIPATVKTAYLGPCECINPKSPALAKVVADLKAEDGVQTVRNILAWLKRHVTYKNEKSDIGTLDFKKVEEIVERGHAECRGYAMLFTALCRAAGIPARPVWGLARVSATPSQPKGNFASHNWTEVYFPGAGWIPVDPQKPETLGWLPATIARFYMDVRRNSQSVEHLPMRNLVHMNGEKINFEVSK